MDDQATIRARLRILRRWRGMTLTELGGLAGLSPSFLSRAERGERMLDRRSHISALARALRVSERDLIGGPHLGDDPLQSAPHAAIPSLRVALETNTVGEPAVDRAQRTLSELTELVHGRVEALRQRCDYSSLGELLPGVIDDLHYLIAASADERDQATALRLLIEVAHPSAAIASVLGYTDLAHHAAAQAVDAAKKLGGDTAYEGLARFLRLQTLPRNGWHRMLMVTQRAVDALEPRSSDPSVGPVYGMLHLTAALTSASSNRTSDATSHLAEAEEHAARFADTDNTFGLSFGPTNAAIWNVMVTGECGDYGGAVERARAIDPTVTDSTRPCSRPPTVLPARRQSHFYIETGRALAHISRHGNDAVIAVRTAETLAPQYARNSTAARQTVAHLLNRPGISDSRRVDLRGMAARMGVPH